MEGVSKISFQCGSRDAKFCVSTTGLDKPGGIKCFSAIVAIEARHATSLHLIK